MPRTDLRELIRSLRIRRASEAERIRFYDLGRVGEDVRLTGDVNFGSEPFLVHIGSHVTIAHGVAFVTHDGGVRVLRDRHPNLHRYAPISIGNHVFIGMGSIILPGVTVGDRTVIGAGSVVTKDIPPGTVSAGVPCRVIRTIEDYESRSLDSSFHWTVGNYGNQWRTALLNRYAAPS